MAVHFFLVFYCCTFHLATSLLLFRFSIHNSSCRSLTMLPLPVQFYRIYSVSLLPVLLALVAFSLSLCPWLAPAESHISLSILFLMLLLSLLKHFHSKKKQTYKDNICFVHCISIARHFIAKTFEEEVDQKEQNTRYSHSLLRSHEPEDEKSQVAQFDARILSISIVTVDFL